MTEQIKDKVISAVASVKHAPRARISLESSLQDLGFDSLDKVTLLFELEKQLQLSIPDEELRSIQSVGDVIEGISRLMAKTAPDSSLPGDIP